MANIKITCDSVCDLPRDLTDRYRIDVLPLSVTLGTELRQDRVDVDSDTIYRYTEKTGRLPVIAPVAVEAYRKAFEDYTAQGMEVIHIAPSSALSGCCANAREAARNLGNIHVVDSRSISTGTGQLALLAAELASADYLAEEIVTALEELKKHLEVSLLVQDSQYIHRDRPFGGFSAWRDRVFENKPELFLRKGHLHRGTRFHGDMESSILAYVRSCLDGRKNVQTDRIFITYSQVPEGILRKVEELLLQLQPFEEILETPVLSAVSQRCGPGSLGLSFLTC